MKDCRSSSSFTADESGALVWAVLGKIFEQSDDEVSANTLKFCEWAYFHGFCSFRGRTDDRQPPLSLEFRFCSKNNHVFWDIQNGREFPFILGIAWFESLFQVKGIGTWWVEPSVASYSGHNWRSGFSNGNRNRSLLMCNQFSCKKLQC